jgi:hypothetical protein
MLVGMAFLIADSPETNTADEIFKEFFSARRRENAFPPAMADAAESHV